MTLQQCIDKLGALCPHQFSDEVLTGWLSDLEQRLFNETVAGSEGADTVAHGPYDDSSLDTLLMLPDAYSEVYMSYLQALIAYHNGETVRYQNAVSMYNAALEDYKAWFTRTHVPVSREVLL